MQNEKSGVAAGVNGLSDVETARIEIVKAAGIKRGIDSGEIDVGPDERGVGCRSRTGSICNRAVDRSVAVCAHVISRGRGVSLAGTDHVVHALGDDAVLKHRLIYI